MGFEFTRHAQDRFKERFSGLIPEGVHVKVVMNRLITSAKRERHFLNNSNFIVQLLEEKGDFDCDFYVHGDVVFVVSNRTVVMTVMDRNYNSMNRIMGPTNHSRFRKKAVVA